MYQGSPDVITQFQDVEGSAMQHEFLKSSFIIDEPFEDLNVEKKKTDLPKADTSKIIKILEQDLKRKNVFMSSEEYVQYTQILVVTQITMNFTNDDPFFRHITNVDKAIRKAILKIFLDEEFVQSKLEFKAQLDHILKLFYQDITIGFITSTGQIKSTAFIFIRREYSEHLHRKTINLSQKSIVKISLHFYNPNAIERIIPQSQELKQSFIRINKFQNDFIILKQEPEQSGQVMFHVYKPVDDQIYFVKRVKLLNVPLRFSEVFNNVQKKEVTYDMIKIQEAKVLSRITHPNILRMYDWWIEQNPQQTYLYMLLEYCTYPGYRSQAKNLLSYSYFYLNPLPYEEKRKAIIDILTQIISGLEYIKKREISHGDLKPESIMVTVNVAGETQIMIADFDQNYKVKDNLFLIKSKSTQQSPLKQFNERNAISETLQALGGLILHLVLTFPGEPTLRNKYVQTFQMQDPDDSFQMFDTWAVKQVKNRNPDFSFVTYKSFMYLAKRLIQLKIHDLLELKQLIQLI